MRVARPSAIVSVRSSTSAPFAPRAVRGRGRAPTGRRSPARPGRSPWRRCTRRPRRCRRRSGRRSPRSAAAARRPRASPCRRRRSAPARWRSGRSGSRARAASSSQCSRASSKSRPCTTSSAPRPRIAATLTGFEPSGMQMIARTPKSRAAKAIDWPWLPVDAVTTPRPRSSGVELRDEVDAAAHLERADRLVVLVLDVDLGADAARRARRSGRAASAAGRARSGAAPRGRRRASAPATPSRPTVPAQAGRRPSDHTMPTSAATAAAPADAGDEVVRRIDVAGCDRDRRGARADEQRRGAGCRARRPTTPGATSARERSVSAHAISSQSSSSPTP